MNKFTYNLRELSVDNNGDLIHGNISSTFDTYAPLVKGQIIYINDKGYTIFDIIHRDCEIPIATIMDIDEELPKIYKDFFGVVK